MAQKNGSLWGHLRNALCNQSFGLLCFQVPDFIHISCPAPCPFLFPTSIWQYIPLVISYVCAINPNLLEHSGNRLEFRTFPYSRSGHCSNSRINNNLYTVENSIASGFLMWTSHVSICILITFSVVSPCTNHSGAGFG